MAGIAIVTFIFGIASGAMINLMGWKITLGIWIIAVVGVRLLLFAAQLIEEGTRQLG